MTKSNFLNQLNHLLKKLPEEERIEILQDYEDHFGFGIEEGKTEEEIVKSLGSPMQISKEILANYRIDQVTTSATTGNIVRAIWAVIGLGFFNLVIVLGPAIALAGVIFTGWVVGLSFLVSPLFVIGEAILRPGVFMMYNFFISLALCGIGYFIVLGMLAITKLTINGFNRYLQYNVSLVKGGLKT